MKVTVRAVQPTPEGRWTIELSVEGRRDRLEIGLPDDAALTHCSIYRMVAELRATPELNSVILLAREVRSGLRPEFPLDLEGPTVLRPPATDDDRDSLPEVWLDAIEQKGPRRYRFLLRAGELRGAYDIEVSSDDIYRCRHEPGDLVFRYYRRGVFKMVERLLGGGRIKSPSKLARDWT